jgi:hypothetical protein
MPEPVVKTKYQCSVKGCVLDFWSEEECAKHEKLHRFFEENTGKVVMRWIALGDSGPHLEAFLITDDYYGLSADARIDTVYVGSKGPHHDPKDMMLIPRKVEISYLVNGTIGAFVQPTDEDKKIISDIFKKFVDRALGLIE